MPEAAEDLGMCSLVVNQGTEEVCNLPAVAEVLVRNPFGLFAVSLCQVHKMEHTKFYRARNRSAGSSTTRRRVIQGSRV